MAKLKPISEIKVDLGINPDGRVQKYLQNTAYRFMGKYVPGGESGELNKNVDLSNPEQITYESIYAHFMYIGKVYIDPKYKIAGFPIRNGKISFNTQDGEIEGWVSRKGIPKVLTSRDLNIKTGESHWDEKMMSAEKDKLVAQVQKYVNRGGK